MERNIPRLRGAHRWKILAESLQRKYLSPRYPAIEGKGSWIGIRSHHMKARNILID